MTFRRLFLLLLLVVIVFSDGGRDEENGPDYETWPWSQRILLKHSCSFSDYEYKYQVKKWWEDYWFKTDTAPTAFTELIERHRAGDYKATYLLESLCFFPDQLFLYECTFQRKCRCMMSPVETTAVNEGNTLKCLLNLEQPCIPKRNSTDIHQCKTDSLCSTLNLNTCQPPDTLILPPLDQLNWPKYNLTDEGHNNIIAEL